MNRAYEVERFFAESQRTTADEIASLIRAGGFLVLEYAAGIGAAVRVASPGHPAAAHLEMLSVAPALQGFGLGRRLVRVGEAMAEATGATRMTLQVVNLRAELSRWYKSLGYREVGTSPYHHGAVKRPCHFIEMAKALAPSVHAGDASAV